MNLKEEAAVLLAELLRLPPEQENETITAFIETMTRLAVAEMQRRPATLPRLDEGGLINKVSGTTYKYVRGKSPLVDFFADKLDMEEREMDSDFSKAKVEHPIEFDAGPLPCDFKEGDKVVVWNDESRKHKAYFSHLRKSDGRYYCFYPGDKWMSDSDTTDWKYCERWEEK